MTTDGRGWTRINPFVEEMPSVLIRVIRGQFLHCSPFEVSTLRQLVGRSAIRQSCGARLDRLKILPPIRLDTQVALAAHTNMW